MPHWILLFFLLFSIAAWPAADKVKPGTASHNSLELCIYLYENGEYQKALDSLKSLVPGLSDKDRLAEAYKYMAFAGVMLDMISAAKENFAKALQEWITAVGAKTAYITPGSPWEIKCQEQHKRQQEKNNDGCPTISAKDGLDHQP